MSKHTPGPWYADDVAVYTKKFATGERVSLCYVACADGKDGWPPYSISVSEGRANARLIAAAPEMYEMLSKLREEMDNLSFNLQTERGIEYAEDTRDSIHALLRRIEKGDPE